MSAVGKEKQVKKHWNLALAESTVAEGKVYRPPNVAGAASGATLRFSGITTTLTKPEYKDALYWMYVPGSADGRYRPLQIRMVAPYAVAVEELKKGLEAESKNAATQQNYLAIAGRFGIRPEQALSTAAYDQLARLILSNSIVFALDVTDDKNRTTAPLQGIAAPMNSWDERRRAYLEEIKRAVRTPAIDPARNDALQAGILKVVKSPRGGERAVRLRGTKGAETKAVERVTIGRGQTALTKLLLLMDTESLQAKYPTHNVAQKFFETPDGKSLKQGPADLDFDKLPEKNWAFIPPLRIAAHRTGTKALMAWGNLAAMYKLLAEQAAANTTALTPTTIGGYTITKVSDLRPIFLEYEAAARSQSSGAQASNIAAMQAAAGPQQSFAPTVVTGPIQATGAAPSIRPVQSGAPSEVKVTPPPRPASPPRAPGSPRGGVMLNVQVPPAGSQPAGAAPAVAATGPTGTVVQQPSFAPAPFGVPTGGSAPAFQPASAPGPAFQPASAPAPAFQPSIGLQPGTQPSFQPAGAAPFFQPATGAAAPSIPL